MQLTKVNNSIYNAYTTRFLVVTATSIITANTLRG